MLAGCATPEPRPTVSVDKTMEYLSGGQMLLRCREPCLAGWRAAQPQAQSLAAAAKWRELVSLLVGVGYQDDLSLYYLGEAAEGLGFPVAAATYYRQSAEISRSSRACSLLSMQCGGVRLPQAARARLAALERPVRPVRRAPPNPPSGGAAPLSDPSGGYCSGRYCSGRNRSARSSSGCRIRGGTAACAGHLAGSRGSPGAPCGAARGAAAATARNPRPARGRRLYRAAPRPPVDGALLSGRRQAA